MFNFLIISELNLVFLTKIKCGIFAYITFFCIFAYRKSGYFDYPQIMLNQLKS